MNSLIVRWNDESHLYKLKLSTTLIYMHRSSICTYRVNVDAHLSSDKRERKKNKHKSECQTHWILKLCVSKRRFYAMWSDGRSHTNTLSQAMDRCNSNYTHVCAPHIDLIMNQSQKKTKRKQCVYVESKQQRMSNWT